jgi:hypothetical protein
MRTVLLASLLGILVILAMGCSKDEEISGTTPPPSGTAKTTPTPTGASGVWQKYLDTATGLSLEYPQNLKITEETSELSARPGLPAIEQRGLTFESAEGLPGMGIAITPNPTGLSLEDWIRTYPGWSSEPTEVSIAGERALRFPINAMGEPNPVIYFAYTNYVVSVKRIPSNVQSDGLRPVMTESEFQRLLTSMRVTS